MSNIELQREHNELQNERKLYGLMLKKNQEHIAEMLKGEMGSDMKDVMSGKKKVTEPLLSRLKYKITYYVEKILKTI